VSTTGLAGLLADAARSGRGVGAFNVFSLEHGEALVAGAAEAGTPVVLQISQNVIRYHRSAAPITLATLALARAADVEAVVHLDHATDVALVHEAVDLGVGSVMFDGSALPYEENVRVTAEVVQHCRARGVDVEAELGEVGGKNGVHAPGARTDPQEAVAFVAATGINALAVAVGSSHAMTERSAALDLELIKEIRAVVEVPLVLHGSSGVPDEEIVRAVRAGMTKINIATHLNKVFTGAVREVLDAQPGLVDSRKYLGPARDAMAAETARLLRMLHAPA
jgi:fructose-bisphosphate aldolase class II